MKLRLPSLAFALLCAPGLAAAQSFDGQVDGYVAYDPADYDYNVTIDLDANFDASEIDYDAPDEDFVWEDAYALPDGTTVEGFYRPRARAGFRWVPPSYRNGVWIPGGWQPARLRQSHVWERGFRGPDGYWVPGFERLRHRNGYTWVSAGWHGKVWVHGHWRPAKNYPGYVWEPGHWTADGHWIDGFWRETRRSGYRWIAGQWRYGRWQPGYWQPVQQRPGHVWVGGYYGPKGWVDGSWRVASKPGYRWVNGYYGPRGWIPGRWERAQAERRHRVRHVRYMAPARRDYQRQWRDGKIYQRRSRADHRMHERRGDRRGEQLERRGERREQQGKQLERRGVRMERAGRRTGNERLEKQGERMQERGQREQQRGRRDQRRGERIQDRHR